MRGQDQQTLGMCCPGSLQSQCAQNKDPPISATGDEEQRGKPWQTHAGTLVFSLQAVWN